MTEFFVRLRQPSSFFSVALLEREWTEGTTWQSKYNPAVQASFVRAALFGFQSTKGTTQFFVASGAFKRGSSRLPLSENAGIEALESSNMRIT